MAMKPPRPCRHPGCPELTRDGWCDKHKPRYTRGASDAWHWMYSLPVWTERLRPAQLTREPFCRECAKAGRRVRATVVDHIVPHRGDWALFTDSANLQSLCKQCHDRKTMRERCEDRPKERRGS